MEPLDFGERRLSRDDWARGLGGSILIHGLVFGLAMVGIWSVPKKAFQGSFATVNLVSSQEIGLDSGALRKGSRDAAGEGIKSQDAKPAAPSAKVKAGPMVPVRRLHAEETAQRVHADIKKLDVPEVPKFAEKSQTASVDKDLDKLIPKPKQAPKPAPIVQESSEKDGQSGAGGSDKTAEKPTRVAQSAIKGAPEGGAKGTSEGHVHGIAESGGKGNSASSAVGSPDGEQLALALRVYSVALKNAILKYWSVPEFLKNQDLRTVVLVVVRRDGRIIDLRVVGRSGQALFDDSAVRAIRKAEPLPAFPAIYSPAQQEFEISFRPQDLT